VRGFELGPEPGPLAAMHASAPPTPLIPLHTTVCRLRGQRCNRQQQPLECLIVQPQPSGLAAVEAHARELSRKLDLDRCGVHRATDIAVGSRSKLQNGSRSRLSLIRGRRWKPHGHTHCMCAAATGRPMACRSRGWIPTACRPQEGAVGIWRSATSAWHGMATASNNTKHGCIDGLNGRARGYRWP